MARHQRPHRRTNKSGTTFKAGQSKQRYKMLFDTASPEGSLLSSQKVYSLNKKFGDKLVAKGRAVYYNIETANRVVNVNGVEMTWGDYLKRKHNLENNPR